MAPRRGQAWSRKVPRPDRPTDAAAYLVGHMLLPAERDGEAFVYRHAGGDVRLRHVYMPPSVDGDGRFFGVHFAVVVTPLTPKRFALLRAHLEEFPGFVALRQRLEEIPCRASHDCGDYAAFTAERFSRYVDLP